ncbi:MAG: peptidoglycan DD-metalloendopeptidase family protein [Acidobacteriota bacterium]|nr:peptidoglycan DD-metalloendopeptidase family protein [Acidobacteriota bacterium]
MSRIPTIIAAAILGAGLLGPGTSRAQSFDPDPVWPLCGRLTENKPRKWKPQKGCPVDRWGNPTHTDTPISSTYGPRLLVSEGYRYDFHRGLDIATPIGTPLFAFSDGIVQHAGPHPSYTDPHIRVRHYRPEQTSCSGGGGCYNSLYLHVSDWRVSDGESVLKRDLIGYTGARQSGFAHVHFEVRSAAAQDPNSSWQRDTIHPLGVLPYPDSGTSNIALTLDELDTSDPLHPLVTASASVTMPTEVDLEGVEVEVWERQPDSTYLLVQQPGDSPIGNTIEGDGYLVEPSLYSVNVWNRHWTYKNSSSIPWSSFETAGTYESPYASILPASYDPHVHLDAQDPADFQVGLFNGMSFAAAHTNANSSHYNVTFRFLALVGTADAADLCVRVRAFDVLGNNTDWVGGACEGPVPPTITSTAVATATEGVAYSYDAEATGVDSWSLYEGPAGLSIDDGSGLVSWALPVPGTYPVEIAAANSVGTDLQSWSLTVSPAGDYCGDATCGSGESCDGRAGKLSCPTGCDGRTNGKPSRRYCYVEGTCEGPGCS